MNVTEKCADFINRLQYENLDARTLSMAKKCIVDWMGCTIGGSSEGASEIVINFTRKIGGNPTSTMIGDFSKSNMINAALVNGYNSHILEMDDVHKASILHPASPIISAVFSTAEALEKSGKDVLTAIVAGYEIAIRIGEAVTPSHYDYWHTTATCGTFGSAAAAAKLFELNHDQTVSALGNAGSQAAGLWEFASDDAMTKYLHCGKAAMNGIIAAAMAKEGLTGAKRILEGDRGFFKAYSSEVGQEEKFNGIGIQPKINDISFKPYASCRHTHSAVFAALCLKTEYGIKTQEIKRVSVKTYKTAIRVAGNTRCDNAIAAKFNLAYCVSAALVYGQLSIREFDEEKLRDPAVSELMNKIYTEACDDIERSYPDKWASEVVIETGGSAFSKRVEYPKGDPENPLSENELDKKYYQLAQLKITPAKAGELLSMCKSIESIANMKFFFDGIETLVDR